MDTATATALNIGTGTATGVNIGQTTTPFLIQGNSTSTITATNSTHTTTVGFTTPTANTTLNFPASSAGTYTICTSDAASCSGTYLTTGNYLAKNAADTSQFAVTAANYLYGFKNTSSAVASGVLQLDNQTNTGNALYVTASGNPGSGSALIVANNTAGSPSGNLLDLQKASASEFSVDYNGNVTQNGGTATTDTINGQTISQAANFTGTVTAATSLLAPLLDTASSGVLAVGTTHATEIDLNQNTKITGALSFSGTNTVNFTTPVGSNVPTKINIPYYDPGSFGQILAFGVPSSANVTSRAMSLFDARTAEHQPTIAVFSPNENNEIGFSWDGSNATGRVETTYSTSASTTSLEVNSGDVTGGSGLSTGNVTVQSGNGSGTNTSSGNVYIDSGAKTGSGTTGLVDVGVTNASAVNIGSSGVTTTNNGALAVVGNVTIQGSAGATIGSTSNNGVVSFLDGTADGFTGTVKLTAAIGSSQNYLLPTTGGTFCLTTQNCSTAGSGYILDQSSTPGTPQASSNFNIAGTGIATTLQGSTSVLTPLLDTPTAVTLNIGTSGSPTTTGIALNQSTTVAANKSLTANGSVLFKDATNSGSAFVIQNNTSVPLFTADTSATKVTVQAVSDDSPVLTVANSDGTAGIELRPGGSGGMDTFIGDSVGTANTVNTGTHAGSYNTGVGYQALQVNSSGQALTAVGWGALNANTVGSNNTALGHATLYLNTDGTDNTAVGVGALSNSHHVSDNTAVGSGALNDTDSDSANTAYNNTAVGKAALYHNVDGTDNTALGYAAGVDMTGKNNTFLGSNAGYQDSDGFVSTTSVQNAAAVGYGAEVQESNALALGGQGATNGVNVGIGTTLPSNTLSVSPYDYQDGSAAVSSVGTTVTGTGTLWRPTMVGEQFIFANGQTGIITAVASQTSLTLDTSQPITTGQAYRIQQVGFQVTNNTEVGIGTINPSARLQVVGGTNDSSLLQVGTSSGGIVGQFNSNGDVNLGGTAAGTTVGDTNVEGTNTGSYSGDLSGTEITASKTGTITSISTTLTNVGTASANLIQVGVYDATGSGGTPGTLLATSPVMQDRLGLNTIPVTANLTNGTSYYLAFWTNDPGLTNTYAGSGGTWYLYSGINWQCSSGCSGGVTNGMPNTFPTGGTTYGFKFNVYATYEPVSAVKAAGSGTALTVQGNSSGSPDIMDVRDSSGTLQDYFDSVGRLNVSQLIQPTSGNSIDLGTSGTTFRTGYFGTSVVSPSFTGAGAVSVTSGAASALTITSNANATWSSTGTLLVDSAAALSLGTGSATSVSIGKSTTTATVNGTLALGASAGSGALLNNGSTVNSAYTMSDLATGGWDAGGASATVDKYTYIAANQSTANQTLVPPAPTANTTYGRIVYVSNIGSAAFTMLGAWISPGATATLVWTHANGGDKWTFAGADGSSILNQNSITQTANFQISGTGSAATLQGTTSVLTPTLDTASAVALNIGTSGSPTTTQINLNQSTTLANGKTLNIGAAAGNGALVNNGSTVNSTYAMANLATGGWDAGGAAATVDIYTSISANQTTTGQTLTVPNPTASTTYGRMLYLSNIGTASFTLLGAVINPGATASLVWANKNGGAGWSFAGVDSGNLQSAYNNSAGGTTPDIAVSTTKLGVTVQNSATNSLGAGVELFGVRSAAANDTTLGSSLLTVTSYGLGVNLGSSSASSTAGDLQFGGTANRIIGVQTQATTATAGANLTVIAATGNTSGAGGIATLQGGVGGNAGAGGAVNISGGTSGGGATAGGAVTVSGGASNATAGSNGGAATLQGGNGTSTGTGGVGGNVVVQGGNSFGSNANAGGTAKVQGGQGSPTGAGGAVTVQGGSGGTTSGAGGALTLQGGSATAGNSAGGNVAINGGTSTGTGAASTITIAAGSATGATIAGGATTINSGARNTSGAGGLTTIQSGAGGSQVMVVRSVLSVGLEGLRAVLAATNQPRVDPAVPVVAPAGR